MKYREVDEFLKKSFSEEKLESPFHDKIDNLMSSLYKKRRRRKSMLIIIPIILISTTVFSILTNIFNFSSVGIDGSAIELAAQNGYIYNLDMEMQTFENLGIRVKNFLIDDINLDIVFEYKIDNNNIKIENIKNICIKDMLIYDENKNIIEKSANYDYKNNIAETSGTTKPKKISNTLFESTCFYQSNNFPNARKIYIEFSTVIFNCKKENKEFVGNWKFEIDVPAIMINRTEILYKCISDNKVGDVTVNNIKLINTGLRLELSSNDEDLLYKTKVSLIINGTKYKPNNTVYTVKEDIYLEKIEKIVPFNLTMYDTPNEIIVKLKNKHENKEVKLIKEK